MATGAATTSDRLMIWSAGYLNIWQKVKATSASKSMSKNILPDMNMQKFLHKAIDPN